MYWNNWLNEDTNKKYVNRLRTLLFGNRTEVYIFLGAGLSYSVTRGRKSFEYDEHEDDAPFPSWPQLIERMKKHLLSDPVLKSHKKSVNEFFRNEGPLDCAELFRNYSQGPNYWDFINRQFAAAGEDEYYITPSHKALTQLPIKQIFTTNYDQLIEFAFQEENIHLLVSSSPQGFLDHKQQAKRGIHHLIKLHGTITEPNTIVLTRSDYSKSRHERSEMFRHLINEFEDSTFLFIGFSLKDPNFNILYDDARYVCQGRIPPSYVVQGQHDPIREAYLSSLGVNTIALDTWNQLSSFLEAINPAVDLATIT